MYLFNRLIFSEFNITFYLSAEEDAGVSNFPVVNIHGKDGREIKPTECEADVSVPGSITSCVVKSDSDIGEFNCINVRIIPDPDDGNSYPGWKEGALFFSRVSLENMLSHPLSCGLKSPGHDTVQYFERCTFAWQSVLHKPGCMVQCSSHSLTLPYPGVHA